MNPSNSPASLLSASPFFKKDKLTKEMTELQERIDLTSLDLKKMVTPRWMISHVPFSKVRVFEFYEATLILLENKVFQIKCEYEITRHILQESRFKLREFVSFNEELESGAESEEPSAGPPSETGQESVSLPQPENDCVAVTIHFAEPGSGPDYYILEAQFYQSQRAWGRMWGKTNFLGATRARSVILPTKLEQELKSPRLHESFLTNISRFKVWLTYLVVFIAMIPEYLIYSKIISSIFEFEGVKEVVAGTVVILLGKINALVILGSVREFFKHQSRVFRIKQFVINRFFLLLFIISFAYCFAIGMLYKDYKDEQNLARDYVMLQQTSSQLRGEAALEETISDDSRRQLEENEKQLETVKSKVYSEDNKTNYLKVFTIGLSGAIILLCSSVLFSMALIFATAYKLGKKIEKAERQLAQLAGHFESQQNFITMFSAKAFQIYCLHGELEFLRRLYEGTPKDAMFDPKKPSTLDIPLPLSDDDHNFSNP